MKISARQYAECLYELVAETPETGIKALLSRFVALLGSKRDLNLAPAIIKAFSDIWNKEHGELVAELTSARKLDIAARDIVLSYLKKKSGFNQILLDEKIDQQLLGGFVLKYNSKIIDGSLKSSLASLTNNLKA